MTKQIENRNTLIIYTDSLLNVNLYKDYCPNGLQVEGTPYIKSILSAVSANQDAVDAAVEGKYDALLVHHGWFWRGESQVITGIKKKRLGTLLYHNINLLAYHLPLDAYPLWGNNAAIGQFLELEKWQHFGDQKLACIADLANPLMLSALKQKLATYLKQLPNVITGLKSDNFIDKKVRRIAWCSGAAQNFFSQAIDAGADVFISGEVSEPCVHLAKESNVAYIACGHHATERDGIRNLGDHLAQKFDLYHNFIDFDSGQ